MTSPIVLAYPIRPIHYNQRFGANYEYYKKNFGTNGHMGDDFQTAIPHGQKVFAAHDGLAQFIKDDHGGEGIHLYNYDGGYKTIYWHLIGDTDKHFPSPIKTDGLAYPVKKGDHIGYANNTGAPFESSGPHLHFGLYLIDAHGNVLNDNNGMHGAIDPEPHFDGTFAEPGLPVVSDQVKAVAEIVKHITPNSPTAQQQESLALKVVELIKKELGELFS